MSVGRHLKINRFILIVDGEKEEHYPSHDFTAGYKCFLCGFLVAKGILTQQKDQYGNSRSIPFITQNTLHGNLRFNKHRGVDQPMTMLEHHDDILEALASHFPPGSTDDPENLLIFSDVGGDANYRTIKALLAYWRVFKARKVGVLHVTGPAPGNSPENPIEAKFGPAKKQLAGMQLPERLHGDAVAPNKQPDVMNDPDKLGRKEIELFVLAGESVCGALNEIDGETKYLTKYLLPKVKKLESNQFIYILLISLS